MRQLRDQVVQWWGRWAAVRAYAGDGRSATVVAPPSPAAPVPSTPTTRARADDTTPPWARRLTQVLGGRITLVAEAAGVSADVIESWREQDAVGRPRFAREVYADCLLGWWSWWTRWT